MNIRRSGGGSLEPGTPTSCDITLMSKEGESMAWYIFKRAGRGWMWLSISVRLRPHTVAAMRYDSDSCLWRELQ